MCRGVIQKCLQSTVNVASAILKQSGDTLMNIFGIASNPTATLLLSLSHSGLLKLAKSLIVLDLSLDVVCGALACPTCCILCVTNCWTFLSAEEGLRENAVRSFCSSKSKGGFVWDWFVRDFNLLFTISHISDVDSRDKAAGSVYTICDDRAKTARVPNVTKAVCCRM